MYDAPSPEAIRRAAARSNLSVERITEVQLLDPHIYVRGTKGGERFKLRFRR